MKPQVDWHVNGGLLWDLSLSQAYPRSTTTKVWGYLSLFLLTASLGALPASAAAKPARMLLKQGWQIQSSCKVGEKSEVISTVGFKPQGWYPTAVPSTVVAALVENKLYPDPYFGMNLRSIPGTTYPIATLFAKHEMPADSPFRCAWWYRTQFRLSPAQPARHVSLHFDGITYRANIWLNGKRIANSDEVAGTFRLYEFNIDSTVSFGKTNTLAVEVFPPRPDDLAYNWVDWNPAPPDKNMGLWREVYVRFSGAATLRYPQVITRLDPASPQVAHLSVAAEVRNLIDRPFRGALRCQIENLAVSQKVVLAPGESRSVIFNSEEYPQLNLPNPRLWWPAQMGAQNLYTMKMELVSSGEVSDHQTFQFGIREITSELTEKGFRLFKVNGRRVLIRGGGWAPDMLLRSSAERLEAEFRYVRHLNLNAIRLEGKLESDEFFDLADRNGILILAGWCCCDHWEDWPKWKPQDYNIAAESLKDQVRRLRNHPSLLVWLNGSDNPPPAEVEQRYLEVLRDTRWPNPVLSSASARATSVTGPTGVKMSGPYDYVPPAYWLTDEKHGGAYGFNMETSPGPAVPPAQSIRRMISAEHLWPIDEFWNYHAGGGNFKNLNIYTNAMTIRYGAATSLEDYARKSQAIAYEGERAMFEAYARNKYTSTGVIQWMLNNAWPSLIWHLYDYYLKPAGGYFGTRKACEPLHVQYSYDDRSVVVVNGLPQGYGNLKVSASVYNLDSTEKFSREATVEAPPDSSTRVLVIPELPGLTTTYFVKLTLSDSSGKILSANFYWLSTKPDVLDWEKSTYFYTPVSSFGDFTALNELPKTTLNFQTKLEHRGADQVAHITVENPGKYLAFMVSLDLTQGRNGEEVLPVLWDENYFALLPGERREITATYAAADLLGARPFVHVRAWNVEGELIRRVGQSR